MCIRDRHRRRHVSVSAGFDQNRVVSFFFFCKDGAFMKSDPVPAAHQAPSDYKILGLGTIVVDHVAEVRSLPEPDSKTDILSSHYQVGGPVVTALALLSKWGYPTSFIGCWSTDELGERIEEDLMKSQIQSGFASVHPSHQSGHAHVWVEASTGR